MEDPLEYLSTHFNPKDYSDVNNTSVAIGIMYDDFFLNLSTSGQILLIDRNLIISVYANPVELIGLINEVSELYGIEYGTSGILSHLVSYIEEKITNIVGMVIKAHDRFGSIIVANKDAMFGFRRTGREDFLLHVRVIAQVANEDVYYQSMLKHAAIFDRPISLN